MRYPPQILEEIRARLPTSAVVGKRVRLKKAGREWKGLSPFNAEKTPSFYVNDQKQFYHCFSSGKHGDIFTFLMETEGLSFPEAVERLAGEAGLEHGLEDADLALGGAARVARAREAVPRLGERDEVGAPAVAVGRQHRADAPFAVRVGADDDRALLDALEHGSLRVAGQAVDRPAEVLDAALALRSHRVPELTPTPP